MWEVSTVASRHSTPGSSPGARLRRRIAGILPSRPTGLSPWTALIPVVGLVAGALFSSSSHAARGTDLRSSASDVADLITTQTRVNRARAAALDTLEATVQQLQGNAAPGDAALAELTRRADALAPEAGRTEVTGSGLTVTLSDSPLRGDQLPEGTSVDDIVVHQQDVQAVVNAIWRGGAEAMMLMDQRVISTSAVRCVGNTLILQGRVYSPPFTIAAIGDETMMRETLERDVQVGIYRSWVDAVGLGYDLEGFTNRTFPAFSGSIRMTHARAGGS